MKAKRLFTLFLTLLLGALTSCSVLNSVAITENPEPVVEDVIEEVFNEVIPPTDSVDTNLSVPKVESLRLGYSNIYQSVPDRLLNPYQWYVQYPSGRLEDGSSYMRSNAITDGFANKYFSSEDDWVKFSLDAQDEGKSANGSSVRSELHSLGTNYYFSDKNGVLGDEHLVGNSAEFKYTFKINCTQPEIAKFTVGQFEMYSGYDYVNDKQVPDKPLIMISYGMGYLCATIKYYTRSYNGGEFIQLKSTEKISLGKVDNLQEVSIKIVLNDRKIDIYRDDQHFVDTSFLPEQDTFYGVYFKLGIYYQTTADDERIKYLFTDVYVKDISLTIS